MATNQPVAAWIQRIVTAALGGIGGAVGFTHTHDWALSHGQTGWIAWADAVVIEGLAIVAGLHLHHDRTAGRSTLMPAAVLVIAFVVQMTAQVAQAEPTAAGWLVAAMPALGFLTVVKLALRHTAPVPATSETVTGQREQEPAEQKQKAQPAQTVSTVVGKLPPQLRNTVTTLASEIHAQGRPVTANDVSKRVSLPGGMLEDLTAELNTHNGYPVTP